MLKPRIFISSVSRELGSARQLVANTLTAIDYEPIWQDIFLTEGGDLRKMLRDSIDGCSAVIQLVGDAYGAEPLSIDHLFGRISYTQYEALYAEKMNKKVYYLFLDNKFPKDNPVEAIDKLPGEETDEKFKERQFLQATYKERIRSSGHLRSKSSSSSELESSILKLRNDLQKYRRNTKLLFAGIFGAIAIVLGAIGWVKWKQDDQTKALGKLTETQAKALDDQAKSLDSQKQQISAVNLKQEQLLEILRELPKVMAKSEEVKKDAAPQQTVEKAYDQLEKKYDIKEGTLKEKLADFSKEIQSNSGTPPLDRANAYYVAKQYVESEKFALEARDLALKTGDKTKAVEALIVAANSALSQTKNPNALPYLQEANQLTDPERDFDQWAKLKRYTANQLIGVEKGKEALKIMEESRDAVLKKYGADDARMWDFNSVLANAYRVVKNYDQAYVILKEIYEKKSAKYGANSRETLDVKLEHGMLMRDMQKFEQARETLEALLKAQSDTFGEKSNDALPTMNVLALTYSDLDQYEKSIELFKKLLAFRVEVSGEKAELTIFSANNLVVTMIADSRYAEALPIAEKYYAIAESALGPDHKYTISAMSNVGGTYYGVGRIREAILMDEELVKARERTLGVHHPDTIKAVNFLANDYSKDQQFDKAIALYEKSISTASQKLGAEDPITLSFMSSLASTYYTANQIDKAKNLLLSVYPSQKNILGFDHVDTRASLGHLRSVYSKLDESEKAISLFREDVDLTTKKYGIEDRQTANREFELATTYELFKKYDLAIPLFEKVLKSRKKDPGPEHSDTIAAYTLLEQTFRNSRKYDKALETLDAVIPILTKKLGPDNYKTIQALYNKGINLENLLQHEKAVPIFESILKLDFKVLPEDDSYRTATLRQLSTCYLQTKQPARAVAIFKDLSAADRRKYGADHEEVVNRMYTFAIEQFDGKYYADTAETLTEAIKIEKARTVNASPGYIAYLLDLKGVSLCKLGKYVEALPILKEVLDIRKSEPPRPWYVPDAESAYGAALTGLKQYTEAEPLLLSGYNGLKANYASLTTLNEPRYSAAIERLIDFYTATNKPAEVKKWKAVLEADEKEQAAKKAAAK